MIDDFRSPTIAVLLTLLCVAGCGDRLGTVPVYGNVKFMGREPPKVCRLFFEPAESTGAMRTSVTDLQPDGSYEVKAYQGSKGLLPGTYRVRVSYFDLKPRGNPNIEADWINHNYDAGELVVDSGSGGVERNIEVPRKS